MWNSWRDLGEKHITCTYWGLKRLEYRGYDSSGIAFQITENQLVKNVGRVAGLSKKLTQKINAIWVWHEVGNTWTPSTKMPIHRQATTYMLCTMALLKIISS